MPVRGQQLGVRGDFVDIVTDGQCQHVGIEAVDNSSCLFARTAVRLLDGDGLAGFFFPVFDEFLIELLIQFPGRIVGDIQQGSVSECGAADQKTRRQQTGFQPYFCFHGVSCL